MSYSEALPDYGDLVERDRFVAMCESGSLIDYDGYGHPVKDGLMDPAVTINPSQVSFRLSSDATHIMWFNR